MSKNKDEVVIGYTGTDSVVIDLRLLVTTLKDRPDLLNLLLGKDNPPPHKPDWTDY